MSRTVILLVDCDQRLAAIVKRRIGAVKGCDVETMRDLQATLDRVDQGGVGLVLWHAAGPDDRPRLLRHLSAVALRQIPQLAMTDADDREFRLQALSHGAVDCLPQPLDESRLEFLVDILTVKARCPCAESCAQQFAGDVYPLQGGPFLVNTQPMRQLMHMLSRVAPLDTTVLLNGETGAGKTHAARVIHDLSPRRERPFVVVRCGALPLSLLESELFGHERGAFTGADREQIGKFAAAQDGTVLLDEIDCVPLEAQVKLLQVVEARVFEPLGSAQTQPFRARLIAATNRPLMEEVAAGRFRADLYYRLNVVAFSLPPLRERPEAILPLARTFLESLSQQAGRTISGLADDAQRALECYPWPGNVRELRNVMERVVALCAGPVVEVADLPDAIQQAHGTSPFRVDWQLPAANELAAARQGGELERLRTALQRNNSNRTGAAAELGISRVTLYKKLHQHRLM